MEKTKKIKLLSIGINQYAHPAISNLQAAVSDAQKLRHFFANSLGVADDHLCQLYDEQATRAAIISSFRQHFRDLKSGDVAVFHFSGHGSQEPCSQAFIDAGLELAGGKNEVLVCHNSRVNDTLSIADKELRLLIAEAQTDVHGNRIPDIHFVCLLDCCHSGSGLRGQTRPARKPLRVRLSDSPNSEARVLGQYLEGQYTRMGDLHIPPADFILMAACSPHQEANEDDEGGLFSNALLKLLQHAHATNHYPSYAEFYSILQESIAQDTNTSQTPHLEYVGKVDPYDSFLQLQGKASAAYPAIVRHQNQWKVNLGAIHGIVYEDVKKQVIPIYHISDLTRPIGSCEVARVELEHTLIHDFQLDQQQKFILADEFNDLTLDQYNPELRVGLSGRKLPLAISGTSNHAPIKVLVEHLRDNSFILPVRTAQYALRIEEKDVSLYGPNEQLLLRIQNYTAAASHLLLHLLFQISKWKNIELLTNTKSTIVDPDKITFSFEYQDSKGEIHLHQKETVAQDSEPIMIEFDPRHGAMPYSFRFTHHNFCELYCYLLHLGRNFGIKQKHEAYTKAFLLREEAYLYQSRTDGMGLGIGEPEIDELEDTFVLIAAKDPLMIPYSLQQYGLGDLYGHTINGEELEDSPPAADGQKRSQPTDNLYAVEWAIRRITVRTVRKKNS